MAWLGDPFGPANPREKDIGFDVVRSAFARLIGALALTVLLSGCMGGQAPDAAIVQIRNMTGSAVAVQINEPYSGTQTLGAPPWQSGACSLGFGTASGHVSVTVWGSTVQGSPSVQTIVPAAPQTWISVIIQPDGTVTFGHLELVDGSCSAGGQVPAPSSP